MMSYLFVVAESIWFSLAAPSEDSFNRDAMQLPRHYPMLMVAKKKLKCFGIPDVCCPTMPMAVLLLLICVTTFWENVR